MNTQGVLLEKVLHPRGPVTGAVKRAGLSAVGVYSAYLAHGLRHPRLLRSASTAQEREEPLPGDDIVPRPDWVTNFSIDIAAPASAVWPWLVQIGYGRAGWYTWFPLDNGGIPSADVIVPALQSLAVGDVIPDGARANEGFGIWRVQTLDPPRAMVLRSRRTLTTGREIPPGADAAESFIDCSWAFVLSEEAPARCRLHVRVRVEFHGRLWVTPMVHGARLLFGLGDNVMENTMLAGIRARAERQMASSGSNCG